MAQTKSTIIFLCMGLHYTWIHQMMWYTSHMKLQISSPDLPLEGTVENHIGNKLGSALEKYLKKVPVDQRVADVHVRKQSSYEYKVTFDMDLPDGVHVFSEETADDFHKAVNQLHDEVARQLKRYKEKLDPQK